MMKRGSKTNLTNLSHGNLGELEDTMQSGIRSIRQARYEATPFAAGFGVRASTARSRRASSTVWLSSQADLPSLAALPDVDLLHDHADALELQMSRKLLACTGVAMVSGFLLGFHTSAMNCAAATAVPGHSVGGWALAVAAMAVGGPVGSSLGGAGAERVGRKDSLLAITALYALGGAGLCAGCVVGSLGALVASRFVVGIAAGATTVVLPIYLGERARERASAERRRERALGSSSRPLSPPPFGSLRRP